MILERAGEGGRTTGDGCEVTGADVERGIVFEEEGPGGGV